MTAYPGHATALLRTADLSGYDGVVASGGDGTLSEVVNGLMQRTDATRPPLGLLPMGTGNAFARELGLMPGALEEALDIIQAGQTHNIDVGHYTQEGADRYFINVVNMCFAAEANRASRRFKLLGNTAYTLGVFQTMLRLRTYPLTLRLDGIDHPHDAVLLAISNSRYTGTDFLIAPNATVDDGLIDIVVLDPVSRRRLLRLFPTIYDGRHVDAPEVHHYRARTIEILASEPLVLSPDGELHGTTPVTFTCLPGALTMFWPAQ